MSRPQQRKSGGKRGRRPTLTERINIINSQDRVKSYFSLSKMFKVDVETVRRTILDKEKYLRKWEEQQNLPKEDIPLHLIRLGQLLPTWVERCKYCKIPITVEFMRRMSQTMEEEIEDWSKVIVKPWLEFFGDQLDLFMESHPAGEEGAPSAGEEDILEALRRECRWKLQRLTPEEAALSRKMQENPLPLERQMPPLESYYREQEQEQEAVIFGEEPSDVIEIDSNDEYDGEGVVNMEDEDEHYFTEPLTEIHTDDGDETDDVSYVLTKFGDIQTHREALKHLKLIENYALKNENFTIIGLINQIENILRDEMRATDLLPEPEYGEHSGETYVDESAIPTEIREFMNNMGYEVREVDESELIEKEDTGSGDGSHVLASKEPPDTDIVFVKEGKGKT